MNNDETGDFLFDFFGFQTRSNALKEYVKYLELFEEIFHIHELNNKEVKVVQQKNEYLRLDTHKTIISGKKISMEKEMSSHEDRVSKINKLILNFN